MTETKNCFSNFFVKKRLMCDQVLHIIEKAGIHIENSYRVSARKKMRKKNRPMLSILKQTIPQK